MRNESEKRPQRQCVVLSCERRETPEQKTRRIEAIKAVQAENDRRVTDGWAGR